MSSIDEFSKKHKKEGYYEELARQLKEANKKYHFMNQVNEELTEGYPISFKDNICVKGVETTCSSEILKGYVPPFSATVVEKALANGFGFLGKTNMDEFGFGTFGTNAKEPARNPVNPDYVSGGSSSGAAVATALMKYHAGVAVSTGGSISSPASFCGVVGFTPTYGLVSRYGLIDFGNSLDKIGVISRSAADARRVFDTIRGVDRYDATCVDSEVRSEKKKKLIVINELTENMDEKIRSAFEKLLRKMENRGYKVERTDLGLVKNAVSIYYIISMAEASTNLARYTGFKYGKISEDFTQQYNKFFTDSRNAFGTEVKRRIILGTFVRGASVKNRYYGKALKARSLLIRRIKELLSTGYLISPTMPIRTPRIKEVQELTPLQTYAMDSLTVTPNLCGFPHVSFPFEYIEGMPVGAQVVTDHFNDNAALSFVEDWESDFKYRFEHNLGSL